MKFHSVFRLLTVVLPLELLVGPAGVSCSPNVPIVNTTIGMLKGFSPYPQVNAYLGVPFAMPPIGNLRFAPPQSFAANYSSVLDATQYSSGCYQITLLNPFADKSPGTAESEDCLTMNILAPAQQKQPLPVLIWLYGGGFAEGSNSEQQYNGVRLVAEQNDIILVSINYRLNAFGFPNSPAIKHKNLGLLDQRLAIEWIRDNIQAFGGDPSRMTLWGHSAGSISISLYSYQYVDDPIVSALIETSGQPSLIPSDDGSRWKAVTNATGCSRSDAEEELACMKQLPPRSIKRGISLSNLPSYGASTGGTPVTDNITFLSLEEYKTRGTEGRFAKLPLLATHTANEADITVPFDPITGINHTLSDEFTLAGFHCPVAVTTGYWVKHNVPVYRYLFSAIFPEDTAYPWIRAYHGSDVILMFGVESSFAYQELSKTTEQAGFYMRNALASFVRDPVEGLAGFGWPKYTGNGSTLVNLFKNNTATATFEDVESFDQSCQQ